MMVVVAAMRKMGGPQKSLQESVCVTERAGVLSSRNSLIFMRMCRLLAAAAC